MKELDNTSDEKLEPWYLQQLLNSISQQQQVQQQNSTTSLLSQQQNQLNSGGRRSVNSNSSNSSLVNSTSANNLELDLKSQKNNSPIGFSSSFSNRNSPNSQQQTSLNGNNNISNNSNGNLLLNSQNSILNSVNLVNSSNNLNSNNNLSTSNHHQQSTTNSSSSNSTSFPNRTRIRTSFDPEHELPKLHRWFAENQHPSRQQIQEYVRILNNLESRRGRKPLDVNNVVYWFKNARAAAKRNPSARNGNGQSPQQLNGTSSSLNNSNSNLNEQLSANELMFAQFNQHQQRQLMNQLQLLNQHQNSNIADLLSSGAGKNALKSLMLKNAGLIDDELLNCETNEDLDDDQQMLNDFTHQSKDSDDEDNLQAEDTEQTFSNFETLDLSVKQQQQQQQQQQQSICGSNLKRRKIDKTTFDECEDQDEKDSIGSVSPINQLSTSLSLTKRNQEFNRNTNLNSSNNNANSNKQQQVQPQPQRFSLNKQLNSLKQLTQVSQSVNQQQQRHTMLDQDNNSIKDDNQQSSLVNSDGELDEENQESDAELDEKDYYTSMLNAAGRNSIGQLAQNLIGNNNLASNFMNPNYLQQTMNDLLMNRLLASQTNNAASALASNSFLSSAAGLIASSAAGTLNPASLTNTHHLAASLNNPSAPNAFGNNLLLNNPQLSPDDGIRRIRRSRTFIDPITEVPRLETWFSQNTHPSHSQIVCYTDELNKLPYRQKFPKLEPKNIQFWFKNRRAKFKRVGINQTTTANAGQTNNSSSTTTSQSNSQSDSPTPPANDSSSLLCMNGTNGTNREFVNRLIH